MYFKRQAENFEVWYSFSTPETIAGRLIVEDKDADVYVTPSYYNHPTIRFIAHDVHLRQLRDDPAAVMQIDRRGRDAILVIEPGYKDLFQRTCQRQPEASCRVYQAFEGGPIMFYFVRLNGKDIGVKVR